MPLNVHAMDPHKPYKTHVSNWYYLQFILTTSDVFTEKRQAQRELGICERKLAFWYRHPTFDVARGAEITREAMASWKSTVSPNPTKVRILA
jgi:hypothetical protein